MALISVPAIRINDDLQKIVPNSVTYNGGEGEITTRAASAGTGNTESIHSENAETQISMIKFSLYPQDDLDANIRQWKLNIGTNEIKMTQLNRGSNPTIRVFSGMSLINSVEREASADGVVELEFSGDPMIIQ